MTKMIELWQQNRENYFAQMAEHSMTILFAGEAPMKSADEAYHFTPNRNFYYLTGLQAPKIIVTLVKTNQGNEATVFIERENPTMARWIGESLGAEQAKTESGIERVAYLDEFEAKVGFLFERHQIQRCYLDLERQQLDLVDTRAIRFAQRLRQAYPALQIQNAYPLIAALRMVKAPAEIAKIEAAIALTKRGITAMVAALAPGKTENQIEAYFDFTLKQGGASDFAFPTICATGKNATILHYNENNQPLATDDLILFDLGAQVDYYNADISRTFPVSGQFSERQKQLYQIVLDAMKAVEAHVLPGVTMGELNQVATEVLAQGCQAIGLIKEREEIKQYYIHSIGHHLGLDTHDVTLENTPLQPGMVITNEPGLYLEAEGIGIRIEDDLLVTETGCRNLSQAIPKEIAEIEAMMQG